MAIRKFTDQLFNNKPIQIYGDGSYKRDFTHVDDIIDGVVKSINWIARSPSPLEGEGGAKYEIFNLGESATTSVLETIELIEKASGKKAKKEFHPAEPGDVPITCADISKSKKILGYNPKTLLKDGIPRFVDWYKLTK